jgi:hypothetical protein
MRWIQTLISNLSALHVVYGLVLHPSSINRMNVRAEHDPITHAQPNSSSRHEPTSAIMVINTFLLSSTGTPTSRSHTTTTSHPPSTSSLSRSHVIVTIPAVLNPAIPTGSPPCCTSVTLSSQPGGISTTVTSPSTLRALPPSSISSSQPSDAWPLPPLPHASSPPSYEPLSPPPPSSTSPFAEISKPWKVLGIGLMLCIAVGLLFLLGTFFDAIYDLIKALCCSRCSRPIDDEEFIQYQPPLWEKGAVPERTSGRRSFLDMYEASALSPVTPTQPMSAKRGQHRRWDDGSPEEAAVWGDSEGHISGHGRVLPTS